MMPKGLPVWVYEWAALLREGVVTGVVRGVNGALVIIAVNALLSDLLGLS